MNVVEPCTGVRVYVGDVRAALREMPAESVQTVVTSPPYWGLRDYGIAGQLGLEETPAEYVANLVEVFREIWRVLRPDGTAWLNLGDSYAGYHGNSNHVIPTSSTNGWTNGYNENLRGGQRPQDIGLKPKDLVGIPWRVALALQADGWWLRSDIIWSKPNPMPESVTDRPTRAHEYIFLLTKRERYFYDADAVREPSTHPVGAKRGPKVYTDGGYFRNGEGASTLGGGNPVGRNRRTVWAISTKPFPEAHFATFPPEIPRTCILAGSRPGDVVLDPFHGSGTTMQVALELGRQYVGCDLNPEYVAMSMRTRLKGLQLSLI